MSSEEEHVAAPKAVYNLATERYVRFVGTEISAATENAFDQSVLVGFVDQVKQDAGLCVADLGCGPGRVAAFMARRSLDVVGVDVSASMIAAARRAHPHLAFAEARLDALPFRTGRLAAAVSWYSIIYTPPDRLADAFSELARVVTAGGHVLLAFQAGNGDALLREQAHGTNLPLTAYRHDVRDVGHRLGAAGLAVSETKMRDRELEHETGPQAFVSARRR